MWRQFGPLPVCHSPAQTSKASNKLKTGSLSQGNAVTSKARIILRVSYEDHYLGDVAILNLGKTSGRVQSSSRLTWRSAKFPIKKQLQHSAKFSWVNSSTSNWKRFEHSHQDGLDTEVLTPSHPASASSWFANFVRQLLVGPQDAWRPNQRFHLLQFWPRLNEACWYWPLVSGKLMLCPLCCIQASKAQGYAPTWFPHSCYQSIWS